jgi:hypothetical protein
MPHYNKWINHIRTGLYGSLSWATLLLLLLTFHTSHSHEHKFAERTTNALLSGLFPVMVASFVLSYLRHRIFYETGIKAFRCAPLGYIGSMVG